MKLFLFNHERKELRDWVSLTLNNIYMRLDSFIHLLLLVHTHTCILILHFLVLILDKLKMSKLKSNENYEKSSDDDDEKSTKKSIKKTKNIFTYMESTSKF